MRINAYSRPGRGFAYFRLTAAVLAALLLRAILPARAEGISSWAALQQAMDQAESGQAITLSQDIIALPRDTRLEVPSGKRVTLDLNGHTLNRGQIEYNPNNGSVLCVQKDAVLILKSSGDGEGKITGGYHDNGGGILNQGTLILEGGSITGNAALDAGGGIANYGTLILVGGKVYGNTALNAGGGVFNQAKARLTVCEDAVYGNAAPRQPDILNDGTLSRVDGWMENAAQADMPVLKRYMAQLTVLPAGFMLLALLLAVLLDKYLNRYRKRTMIVIIALVFGMILQNVLEYRFASSLGSGNLRLVLSVFGYAVRPVILALFLSIVKPGGRYGLAWALVGVNGAVYLTAFFSHLTFWYTVNGHFKSGPLRHTCTVVSALLFIWLFALTMRQFHPRAKKESWIPLQVAALIAGSVYMDYTVIFDEQPLSFLTIAVVISCVFYYMWLHLQFVREHEDGLRAQQRIQIMKTQIQPHFLFNTLNTIRAVYATDPPLAEQTLEKFSNYLRQNLDALEQPDLIPFAKELEHTRLYADIEMLRFPYIRMEYQIRDGDFSLPALTVQPMVENAIRHGVRSREEGVVSVSAWREEGGHVIQIRDNGVGFDVNALRKGVETHIGIENVRSRVERLCGGEFKIESGPGQGTCVTIRIPLDPDGSGKEKTA